MIIKESNYRFQLVQLKIHCYQIIDVDSNVVYTEKKLVLEIKLWVNYFKRFHKSR